ncbi:sialidase family protein [Candidatus Methylomirabilis sp.]|uniref:sialidase family protein n=1 Tax=Candidatus Methylomirabilis sp. TaxID=2032687 RepID=UPI002A64FE39|nr:sialidase family protein [Candidatus Methylomirabilis sp.]
MTQTTRVLFILAMCIAFTSGCVSQPRVPPTRPVAEKLQAPREGPEFPSLMAALGPKGELYLVFHTIDRDTKLLQALFARSTDLGVTWDKSPVQLFSTTDQDVSVSLPIIQTDEKGGIYLVWRWKRQGIKHIFFTRSLDGGRTWPGQPTQLAIPGQPFAPLMDVDPTGHLSLLWQDEEQGKKGFWFVGSIDSGATWQAEPVRLTASSPSTARLYTPGLTSDGRGHVYAVWHEVDHSPPHFTHSIKLNRSADFGATWLPSAETVYSTPHHSPPWPVHPSLFAESDGHVYLLWQEYDSTGIYDLYFIRSDDAGVTWHPKVRLNTTPPREAMARHHQLAFDGRGNLYAVWVSEHDQDTMIAFRRSTDFGETWGPELRLDERKRGVNALSPVIVTDVKGHVVTVWQQEERKGWGVYTNRSDDFGVTWLPRPLRLDTLPERASHPRLIQLLSDRTGHPYVVWRGDPFGKEDFFMTRSTDHGKSWLPKEQWLTDPSELHLRQAAVQDGGPPSRP